MSHGWQCMASCDLPSATDVTYNLQPATTTTKTSVSPLTAKTLTPASAVLTAVLKQALGLDDVTGI